MTIKIQEPFKFLKHLEGAEKWHKSFEKMCSEILHFEHSNDTVMRIDGSGGDDGIDVLVKASDTKMSIYQCKFYTDTFHKEKISSSFLTAYKKNENEKFKQWVLVIPKTLTNSERIWWDEFTQEHNEKGIEFKIWDEDKIVYLLKKNRLYDSYFLNENELKERRRSEDMIAEWKEERNVFEETSVYLRALDVLKQNNILVLRGQSQSGKTSIARNICCSTIEEDQRHIVLSITLNEFKNYYDSYKLKRIYLFDNVFGERAVEEKRFSELNEEMISYLNKAIRAGSKIIFTSRDYIFKEVINSGKLTSYFDKFPHLFDEHNIVDVEGYSLIERKNILMKHVNLSNMEEQKKLLLKNYYNKIIRLEEFTPELIRRLVDDRLNKKIEFSWSGIENYFKNPINYLLGLYNDLDEVKKTALLLMLLNEGQLPTLLDDKFLKGKIEIIQENVDALSLKKALTHIPSSLIKRETIGNQTVWKFHHPSIEEALVERLVNNVKKNDLQIELFIKVADFRTLIDNITVCSDKKDRIFISKELWINMSTRLFETIGNTKSKFDYFEDSYIFRKEDLVRFFAWQTNDDFLEWFDDYFFSESKKVWNDLVSKSIFNQLHSVGSYELAYRLDNLGLLPLEKKLEVIGNIEEVARGTFDVTFLKESNMQKFIGEEKVFELLEYYKTKGVALAKEEMDSLFDNDVDLDGDLREALDCHFESWCSSVELLRDKLSESDLLTSDLDCEFEDLIDQVEQWKEEIIEEHEIESEESRSLHEEMLAEFVRNAIYISSRNDHVKLVKELIAKMVTDLSYNYEDAVIYVGKVLNSEDIKGHSVIINLQEALTQYVEDNAHDNI